MALQSRLPGAGPPRGSALGKGLGFAVTETGGEEGALAWLAGHFLEGTGLAASHHLPRSGPVSGADDSGPSPVLSAASHVPEDRRVADGGTRPQVRAWPGQQPGPGELGGQWPEGLLRRPIRAGPQLGAAFRRLSIVPGLL